MERFKNFIINENSVIKILGSDAHSFDSEAQAYAAVRAAGGQVMGGGAYGTAILDPALGDNRVIKIFNNVDECYLKFARYCYDNPHVNLPRFYSKPRKFVPSWTRENTRTKTFMYYVIMERLDELPRDEYIDIVTLEKNIEKYRYQERRDFPDESYTKEYKDKMTELVNKNPKYLEFVRFKALLENGYIPVVGQSIGEDGKPVKSKCGLDLHDGNIMKRGDEFVITDPYSSFNQNRLNRLENDYHDKEKKYEPQYPVLPPGKKYPSRYKGRKKMKTDSSF